MWNDRTGLVDIDKDKWEVCFAYTISPRSNGNRAAIEEDELDKRVGDFFNKASSVFGIHIARYSYKNKGEGKGRPHHHGIIFQLKTEAKVRLSQWRSFASVFDLFSSDNLLQAFKSIDDVDSWMDYMVRGHRVAPSWISCPRIGSQCKSKKNRRGARACAIRREHIDRRRV